MIYIFPSNHLDDKEIPEIKAAFRKLGPEVHVAIELESDSDTKNVLENIRNVTDTDLRRIIRRHYLGPESPAYFNFLKLLSQGFAEGVKGVFPIEPSDTAMGRKLTRDMTATWNVFKKQMEPKNRDPEMALESGYNAIRSMNIQGLYREEYMVKIIGGHLQHHPGVDLFVYSGYGHMPHIIDHFRKIGVRYMVRDNSASKGLVENTAAESDLVKKNYRDLGSKEKLILARDVLDEALYFYLKKINMQEGYDILKRIKHRIRTLNDFEKAVADYKSFIRTIV